MNRAKQNARGWGAAGRFNNETARQFYRAGHLASNWRERLPSPEAYYSAHVEKLSRANGNGWAQGVCPFHEDKQASLSVNIEHGGWRCFAGCGAGDMVAFHQRITGVSFRAAVADLTGARND